MFPMGPQSSPLQRSTQRSRTTTLLTYSPLEECSTVQWDSWKRHMAHWRLMSNIATHGNATSLMNALGNV